MVDIRSLGGPALIIGCLLMIASLPATGMASGTTLIVDAPESAQPGEEVTVSITINSETPIYGIQYSLSFGADSLSVQSVDQGTFFSDEGGSLLLAKETAESDGRIEYGETRQGADTGITGSGIVTRITFVVDNNPGAEEVQFTLNEVKVADPNGQPIETTTEPTTLAIGDAAGTATGGAQSTDTATSQPTSGDQSTPEPWREKLTATLEAELANADVVPVIVVVSDSADPTPVADALEQQGADDVQTLASINAVAAVVDADVLAVVAQRSDVDRIRYDSRVSVNTTAEPNETGTATGTVPSDSSTSQPSESASATTVAGGSPSDDTGTSTSADGFGIVSTLVCLVALITYVTRKTR